MVQWIHDQWPSSQVWEPATIRTTFDLIKDVDAADGWSGVFDYHALGMKWAPQPPEVVKAILERHRERPVAGIPRTAIGEYDPAISLPDYLKVRGFASFDDAVLAWRGEHGYAES